MLTAATKLKDVCCKRKAVKNLDSILESKDITLPPKVCIDKAMFFFNSHVQMWELDHKEGWTLKNWCFQTVGAEKRRLLRVPWTSRRSNQSILKEISPDYSVEGLILKLKLQYWPPDVKSHLIGNDPNAGKDWGLKEKGMTEDKMAGLHCWLSVHEFEQTLGNSEGQGSLACCSSWGHKESNTTVTAQQQENCKLWTNKKRNCLKAPESEQKQEASFGVPTVRGGSCLELLTFTVFRVWADIVKMRQVLGVPMENNSRHSCSGNKSAKSGQLWKLKLGWRSAKKEKIRDVFLSG